MRITCPHMGSVELFLGDLFERLDVDYMPPPPTTQRTLRLGLQHSPEFACLPLKLTLGNLIEGLDAGADATAMIGGQGPCRFGYYADIQRRIIEGLGYDFTAIILEPPSQDFRRFLQAVEQLAPRASYAQVWRAVRVSFRKAQAYDRLDRAAIETRGLEAERGATSRAHARGKEILNAARSLREIVEAEDAALRLFADVPRRDASPLRITLVGEFFLLLEPFINFDIETYLGDRGIWLQRSVYLTDWIGPTRRNPVGGHSDAEVAEAASPYLAYRVGGEGQATIGHSMLASRDGHDGVIQLLPFTCMPDTIAKSILPSLSAREDIPVLTLIVDEQTGKAGVHTRLEAFLDLLASRRRARRAPATA